MASRPRFALCLAKIVPCVLLLAAALVAAQEPSSSFLNRKRTPTLAILPFAFRAPAVSQREQGEITATVRADGKDVPVKPFALQVYPKRAAEARTPAGWALFDPVGKTRKALEFFSYRLKA